MIKQKGFISGGDVKAMFFMLIMFGVFIGFVLFVGIPWLWQYIKPFVHAMTA
ncbi:MAG: hypothetical protein ACRCT6_03220 [Notoacmeibacter sp.]